MINGGEGLERGTRMYRKRVLIFNTRFKNYNSCLRFCFQFIFRSGACVMLPSESTFQKIQYTQYDIIMKQQLPIILIFRPHMVEYLERNLITSCSNQGRKIWEKKVCLTFWFENTFWKFDQWLEKKRFLVCGWKSVVLIVGAVDW